MSASADPSRVFKQQSSQLKAIQDEVVTILDVTRMVYERVTTNPPPAILEVPLEDLLPELPSNVVRLITPINQKKFNIKGS
jgi:hypothetical protein